MKKQPITIDLNTFSVVMRREDTKRVRDLADMLVEALKRKFPEGSSNPYVYQQVQNHVENAIYLSNELDASTYTDRAISDVLVKGSGWFNHNIEHARCVIEDLEYYATNESYAEFYSGMCTFMLMLAQELCTLVNRWNTALTCANDALAARAKAEEREARNQKRLVTMLTEQPMFKLSTRARLTETHTA